MGKVVPATEESIQDAAVRLRRGELVAFPTETVYGLGAAATDDRAVARIFEAKERPSFNPLIVHVAETAAIAPHVEVSDLAIRLAAAFWPGPLTLVMRRAVGAGLSRLVSAGLDTVAVRVPRHPVARALLREVDLPVAAPSANVSGRLSPTTAAHVAASLGGRVDLILDGGPCLGGLESTIVDATGAAPRLLRAGLVTVDEIEAVAGPLADAPSPSGATVEAPGMMDSHYAPAKPLRLDVSEVGRTEGLLAFGEPLSGAAVTRNLSPAGDLVEAAANLFAMLHDLDAADVTGIAVMPVPAAGLGIAINDRLRRAAAPREPA